MMKITDKTIVVPKKEQQDLTKGKEGMLKEIKSEDESVRMTNCSKIVICYESLKIP